MRALGASRTSVVPGGALAGGWTRNPLWKTARTVPSLDLRFADNKSLVDATTGASLVTFTRASSGTFVGSDGVLRTAVTNEPRFDHNPTTGESLGLLVEEARTNSIRNNTMVGAVAGTPGTIPTNWTGSGTTSGITREIVGTGIENGINYIDYRIAGTTTGALFFGVFPEVPNSVAATNGQTWTFSSYARLIAGSLAGFTSINFYIVFNNSIGARLQFVAGGITPTSAALNTQRFTRTGTASNALIAFVQPSIQFEAPTGTSIDITLRIGLPQLEQGAFATSAIPTTTATVTRAADVASIGSSAFSGWFSPSLTDHTFYVDAVIRNAQANGQILEGFQALDLKGVTISLDGIGTRPRVLQRHGASRLDTSGNYPLWSAGVPVKIAVNTSSASQTASNGAFPPTLGSAPAQIDWTSSSGISIGSRIAGSSAFVNNHIRRIVFWNQPLPGSTLQQITQP